VTNEKGLFAVTTGFFRNTAGKEGCGMLPILHTLAQGRPGQVGGLL